MKTSDYILSTIFLFCNILCAVLTFQWGLWVVFAFSLTACVHLVSLIAASYIGLAVNANRN